MKLVTSVLNRRDAKALRPLFFNNKTLGELRNFAVQFELSKAKSEAEITGQAAQLTPQARLPGLHSQPNDLLQPSYSITVGGTADISDRLESPNSCWAMIGIEESTRT